MIPTKDWNNQKSLRHSLAGVKVVVNGRGDAAARSWGPGEVVAFEISSRISARGTSSEAEVCDDIGSSR